MKDRLTRGIALRLRKLITRNITKEQNGHPSPNQERHLAYQQTGEELQESETLLELIFTQSLYGFFFMMLDEPVCWDGNVDKEAVIDYVLGHQRIIKINDAMLAQYQATRDQMLGLTPNDLFEQGLILSKQKWRTLYEQGRLHTEAQEKRFDGTPMWIEGDYMCVYDKNSCITGSFGIQRDVTKRKHAEEALGKSEERFHHVMNSISDYIYVTEMPEHEKPVNRYHSPNIERLTGYPFETFMSDWNFWITDVIFPEDRVAAMTQAEKLAKGQDSENEYRLVRADGEIIWVRDSGRVQKRKDGTRIVYGVISDITERKKSERLLRKSFREQERRTRELYLLNQMSALFQTCHTEEETYKVVVSTCKWLFPSTSGCLQMLDASKMMLEEKDFWGEPPPNARRDYIEKCQPLSQENNVPDLAFLETNLAYFPQEGIVFAPIMTQGEILGQLSFCFEKPAPGYSEQDRKREMKAKRMVITRIVAHYALFLVNLRLREALKVEAIQDPLTHLYNRRYLETSLEREIYRAKRNKTPVGILMLDLDHFKKLNDTYGHTAGDLLLQKIGALLKESTRVEDIACRYGGEEFLLILPGASLENCEKRARHILRTIRKFQLIYQGNRLKVTISVGVAALPEHGFEVSTILKTADSALYQAKTNGRDQVIVAPY